MKRLTLPISKKEIKNCVEIDDERYADMEYLGIVLTPYRAEEGLDRWEKMGCESPFTSSETYSRYVQHLRGFEKRQQRDRRGTKICLSGSLAKRKRRARSYLSKKRPLRTLLGYTATTSRAKRL